MPQDCTWIFGRGASIANGLPWVVPQSWKDDLIAERVTRDAHVRMIMDTLREEIARVPRWATPYRRLLDAMSTKTVSDGHHRLLTTNWDYLLQRDVLDWVEANTPGYAPRFLSTPGTVYHLNGSVEPGNFKNRSPFLLETDTPSVRKSTFEANQALNLLLWSTLVVVVGMSFECNMDCGLLGTLRAHQDHVPIGSASFVIVEPSYGITLQQGEEGTGPPPHSHDWDEAFYVLKGEIHFLCDGKDYSCTTGTLVHVPRGTVHGFRYGKGGGQMLEITGAGALAAQMFTAIDKEIPLGPPDVPKLLDVLKRNRVTVAG